MCDGNFTRASVDILPSLPRDPSERFVRKGIWSERGGFRFSDSRIIGRGLEPLSRKEEEGGKNPQAKGLAPSFIRLVGCPSVVDHRNSMRGRNAVSEDSRSPLNSMIAYKRPGNLARNFLAEHIYSWF